MSSSWGLPGRDPDVVFTPLLIELQTVTFYHPATTPRFSVSCKEAELNHCQIVAREGGGGEEFQPFFSLLVECWYVPIPHQWLKVSVIINSVLVLVDTFCFLLEFIASIKFFKKCFVYASYPQTFSLGFTATHIITWKSSRSTEI